VRHDGAVPARGSGATRALGCVALACAAVHGGYHLAHGRACELLWGCEVAAISVGAGLLLRAPLVNAAATLVLLAGLVLWGIDLASGGEFLPTSPLVHVGALSIGVAGCARLGLPRGAWRYSLAGLFLLHVTARLLTPADMNVNLAFAVHPSAAGMFPSHTAYIAMLTVILGGSYFALERALLRAGFRQPPGAPGSAEGRVGCPST